MSDADSRRQRWQGLSAFGLVLLVGSVSSVEAQRRERTEELVIGPFLVAPSLSFAYDADTNVRRSEDSQEDTYSNIGARVVAELPFRRSSFELLVKANDIEYTNNSFASALAYDLGANLELRFSGGQRLQLRESFRHDFTQVRDPTVPDITPGEVPEDAFFGEPFNENELSLQFDALEDGRRGYLMRIERGDFVYQGDQPVALYEYRGYSGLFQYHHPLAAYKRLIGHYEMRRYNHYDPNSVDPCVGVPYRREVSDSLELGLEGSSRGDYTVRMGWGRFEYLRQGESCFPEDESGELSSFHGVTGFARWRQPLGARTALIVIASRRPLPSHYETYYLSDSLRLVGERHVSQRLYTGMELGYDQSRYADLIAPDQLVCDGTRSDRRWDARASATWDVHRLFRARAVYAHDERNSNCEGVDYASDSISVGLAFGWQ